ncbi:hypothetical protein AB0B88_16365 [Micromonospora haikouensis]|uniref:hypothetical protein n=1 Tax=Micromonospora haikouensis TaxID=686309 RepID=UPI0033C2D0FB
MASTNSTPPPTVETLAAQELADRMLKAARRLDDLAADIRRAAAEITAGGDTAKVNGDPVRVSYARAAARVINAVGATVANMSLGALATAAAEADNARGEGR